MPPPVRPPGSLRWQLLTSELETRARWSAHCARMAGRPSPAAPGVPAVGGAEPAARGAATAADPAFTRH